LLVLLLIILFLILLLIKLSPLLKLKYNNAIADAVADLGQPEEIGKVFIGFQKYLYEKVA